MKTYNLDLNVTLAYTITVEADSYEEAVRKAQDEAPADYNQWDNVGEGAIECEDEEE